MRCVFCLLLTLLLAGCNLNATSVTTTPFPTPNIPRVRFISPEPGNRVVEDYDLTIDILGEDDAPGAGVAKIELYLNGALYRTAEPEEGRPQPVFRVEMNWFTEGAGLHAFSAIAYRRDGTRSDEAVVSVEVVSR